MYEVTSDVLAASDATAVRIVAAMGWMDGRGAEVLAPIVPAEFRGVRKVRPQYGRMAFVVPGAGKELLVRIGSDDRVRLSVAPARCF